jgi:hypothetical protein
MSVRLWISSEKGITGSRPETMFITGASTATVVQKKIQYACKLLRASSLKIGAI